MAESLPPNAVVRLSRGTFDPQRFEEVDDLARRQAEYLVPAVLQLPGLLRWYTGVSREGSMVQMSVWDSDGHAAQMNDVKEMSVRARGEMEALGLAFIPIVNYPITWSI